MRGIITAAGRSSRMNGINKACLTVNGKPVIQHCVELLRDGGINEIAIVVGESTYLDILPLIKNGRDLGVSVSYFYQNSKHYGFPSAVLECEMFIDDLMTVVCGDNYIKGLNLKDMSSSHKQGGITVAVQEVSKEEALEFAVARNTAMGIKFDEKPSLSKIEERRVHIYAGPFVAERSIFQTIKTLKPSERNELEITSVFNAHDISLYSYNGFFADIGTPERYSAVK